MQKHFNITGIAQITNNFEESKKLFPSPLESGDEGNETTDKNKLCFCLFLNFKIYIQKALGKKNT